MRCLASSATAIFTPASAYFMVSRLHEWLRAAGTSSVPCRAGTCERREAARKRSSTKVTLWMFYANKRPPARPSRGKEGGAYILKHMKQPAPPHGAGMNQGIPVGKEPGGDVAVPGVARRVQRHIDEHRRAEDVVARHATPVAGIERVLAVV